MGHPNHSASRNQTALPGCSFWSAALLVFSSCSSDSDATSQAEPATLPPASVATASPLPSSAASPSEIGAAETTTPGLIDPTPAEETSAQETGAEGPLAPEQACQAVSSEANIVRRPMDIIVVVDNSGSMADEIEAVERNINVNFASILGDSNIDARVILFSGYRPPDWANLASVRVCVGPPLGPSACDSRSEGTSPHNSPAFFHFDQPVYSRDGPSLLLATAHDPPLSRDVHPWNLPTLEDDAMSQNGWLALLRPEAFKAFIMIGDDSVDWEDAEPPDPALDAFAAEFDERLRTLAPSQFGAPEDERQYVWHSIVGVVEKTAADSIYEIDEPLVESTCESAKRAGVPHQQLSLLTDGLRFPICLLDDYDQIFRRIATEIVVGSALPCNWAIPEPPDGQTFDRDQVNLSYVPSDGSMSPEFVRVDSADACEASTAWYYDDPNSPTTVHACPAACELLNQGNGGRVDLLFGCATRLPTLK